MNSFTYPVHPWCITENSFDKATVKKNESVFSLGNGYLGLRGSYEEGFQDKHLGVRGTYLNAFYETEKIRYGEIAYAFAEESQTMLNVTDARRICVTVEGETFHMANMAGTWMDVTSGFAGMYANEKGLSFKPTLPKALKRYAFTVAWRGRRIHVDVSHEGAIYTLVSGEPVDILADGKTLRLA